MMKFKYLTKDDVGDILTITAELLEGHGRRESPHGKGLTFPTALGYAYAIHTAGTNSRKRSIRKFIDRLAAKIASLPIAEYEKVAYRDEWLREVAPFGVDHVNAALNYYKHSMPALSITARGLRRMALRIRNS